MPNEALFRPIGRTRVMGILNITTDSFSDGGAYLDLPQAIAHAEEMVAAGADIIDVGGESTRPGATRVTAEVETQRVVPVIRELCERGIACSVDTMRATVAAAAVDAGAVLINDVSGGLADPAMYAVMADTAVPCALMHWNTQAFGDAAGQGEHEGDVINHVYTHLQRCTDAALATGVTADNIIWDPGLGFAKNAQENWQLLAGLPRLREAGFPVLVGASRKRFLVALRTERGMEAGPQDADAASAAITALAAQAGAWAVRVHDAAASRDAVTVASYWQRG
ncbi:MAG: dihydropteroate synthase [Corynebacterium sp.]|nr:dihydropteroate synthase [Corynebacterium sp.]